MGGYYDHRSAGTIHIHTTDMVTGDDIEQSAIGHRIRRLGFAPDDFKPPLLRDRGRTAPRSPRRSFKKSSKR